MIGVFPCDVCALWCVCGVCEARAVCLYGVCTRMCVSVMSGVCLRYVHCELFVECVECIVCLCVRWVHGEVFLCGELCVCMRFVHGEVCVCVCVCVCV